MSKVESFIPNADVILENTVPQAPKYLKDPASVNRWALLRAVKGYDPLRPSAASHSSPTIFEREELVIYDPSLGDHRAITQKEKNEMISCVKRLYCLSNDSNISFEQALNMFEQNKITIAPKSLGTEFIGKMEGVRLSDTIKGDDGIEIGVSDKGDLTKVVHEALSEILNPRELRIISLRFGLTDGASLTLEQVGSQEGVTRERIRQIETKALSKIRRNPMIMEQLREFLD